jgi:hypothetical protein
MDYNKKKPEEEIETAQIELLRSAEGYTGKDQIRNANIRKENLSAKIIKSRSQWKYYVQRIEDKRIPKKILTNNPKRKQNVRRPQLRWRDQHTLQKDGNRARMV